ncbi:hypothetical protein AMTRI_Chr06g178770 [Amborella trichopoda]
MPISEVSPETKPSGLNLLDLQTSLLSEIEASIQEIESISPSDLTSSNTLLPEFSSKLRKLLSRLNSALPLPENQKLQAWKLSYRLWNASVDLTNSRPVVAGKFSGQELRPKSDEEQAKLRQIATDILVLAGNPSGIPSPTIKAASFCYKTGLIWHDLKRYDLAASCFERVADLAGKLVSGEFSGDEGQELLFDLQIARSATAWDSSQKPLALTFIARAQNLLSQNPNPRSGGHYKLANQFFKFGKSLLSNENKTSGSKGSEPLKLLSDGLDLCEKGISLCSTREALEIEALKSLRSKCLKFMAAVHLQREEYESVMKCVRVVYDKADSGVAYMALKGWLGLGEREKAERELIKALENRWWSNELVAEAVSEVVYGGGGEVVHGEEVATRLCMTVADRMGAGAMVRGVERLCMVGRGETVGTVAGEERVVAVFAGKGREKERTAMHAVLWNCAAEYFRAKNYRKSSEIFDKCMLYIAYDMESRVLRAKCLRALCLCHLALCLYDQADEYISEAQKLEPNIVSGFLKFKIYLQKQDQAQAISQVQSMPQCPDFDPEFLTLAAHEATACQAIPVAIASLSSLLSLYSPETSLSSPENPLNSPEKLHTLPEVAVIRNLITLHLKNSSTENPREILLLLRRANTRMNQIGLARFFGKGSLGSRELKWFAGISWNSGMKAGKEREYKETAEFLEVGVEFYVALEDGDERESKTMVCKCLIIGAAATITREKIGGDKLHESDIKKVASLLERAGKLLPSMSQSLGPDFFFLYTFNSYELHGHLNDPKSQTQILKTFISSPICNPNHLLHLGLNACDGPRPNIEAATLSLDSCLNSLLSSASPDYHKVALVFRKLAGIAGYEDGALGVYEKARQVIVGLKEGEYPSEEAKWLAIMAWNKGGPHLRFGRNGVGERWMRLGLQIAMLVKGMEGYVGEMNKWVEQMERAKVEDQREERESRL